MYAEAHVGCRKVVIDELEPVQGILQVVFVDVVIELFACAQRAAVEGTKRIEHDLEHGKCLALVAVRQIIQSNALEREYGFQRLPDDVLGTTLEQRAERHLVQVVEGQALQLLGQ